MFISVLISAILYLLSPIISASEECDAALKDAYAQLSSGSVKSLPIPAVCEDSSSLLNKTIPIRQARTAENAYCSTVFKNYYLTMTSYSYDESLNEIGDVMLETIDVSDILKSGANGCGSGLSFLGTTNSTEGWTLFVESYDSTSDQCDFPTDDSIPSLEDLDWVITGGLEEWAELQKRTSFCIAFQPVGSTWRGTIRGLYSNETMFTSPANIPCVLEYDSGFVDVPCFT